jgi:TolA-binding protein
MSKTHVIDGVTYVEVDRKAKSGDKLWLVNVKCSSKAGGYYAVNEVNRDIENGDVKVLDPDVSEASPSITDLIANLARRVSSLEQQLKDTQGNVEKLAEELADVKYNAKRHIESLTCDIITLDERTQVVNAINKFYEEGSR